MAPVERTGTWVPAKTAPIKPRGPVAPLEDTLPAVLRSLATRKGYDLTTDEQRVLRACLCLAGAHMPLRGLCDLDFFVALDRFQTEAGEKQTGLSTAAIAHIVAAASHAVGATGRFAPMRAAWFDAFEAPRLLRELSSMALLIRALRQAGKTA